MPLEASKRSLSVSPSKTSTSRRRQHLRKRRREESVELLVEEILLQSSRNYQKLRTLGASIRHVKEAANITSTVLASEQKAEVCIPQKEDVKKPIPLPIMISWQKLLNENGQSCPMGLCVSFSLWAIVS